jgi:2-succinyl-5-enolpyruvyl-6-hydroxy-3-cyclohexene-1-carboxylate synthase
MTQADARAQHHFVAGLVGGLADLGLRHVWITPGSRSTPLTLGFAGRPEVRSHVHLDERSAAFSALGMATVTDRPVALVCTSGTAAAEYLPAVVEARYGRVPLLLFTADRPPELRHTGAHQTIDQVHLFGGHARWFHDPGPIDVTAGAAEAGAVLASRVWEEAAGTPPGPVHVNLPFREPLLPSSAIPVPAPGKHDRREAARPRPDPGALDDVAARLSGRRVLIVCGPQRDDALPGAVAALASALDAPVLADALSGLRRGGHGHDHVVSAGHALGGAGWLDRHPPEVILRRPTPDPRGRRSTPGRRNGTAAQRGRRPCDRDRRAGGVGSPGLNGVDGPLARGRSGRHGGATFGHRSRELPQRAGDRGGAG